MQAQAARGENQNRPEGAFVAGGPVGGSAGPANANASAPFHDRVEGSNHVMSPSTVDVPEHDPAAYAYPAVVGGVHNGTAGGATY